MLWNPVAGESFAYRTTNHPGRPSASMGTAVSAGSAANVMSDYQNILAAASITTDLFGLYVCINANTRSASARDTLVDIAASPPGAGGYTTIIPNLLGSCAGTMAQGGIWYYFPLYIPSGTNLGARAQINSSLLGNLYVYVVGFGQPRNPEALKFGNYVFSVGAVSASSAGTSITSGTTNDGAWTSLGSSASPAWWWQCGMGCNDSTMNPLNYTMDVAAGSPVKILIEDQTINQVANSETMSKPPMSEMCEDYVPADTVINARLQCSGTADGGLSGIAYGLGG